MATMPPPGRSNPFDYAYDPRIDARPNKHSTGIRGVELTSEREALEYATRLEHEIEQLKHQRLQMQASTYVSSISELGIRPITDSHVVSTTTGGNSKKLLLL